jgi:hypothetical protein
VILRTRITQIKSNHSLGFCGLRTWLCADATQDVSLLELFRVLGLSRLLCYVVIRGLRVIVLLVVLLRF